MPPEGEGRLLSISRSASARLATPSALIAVLLAALALLLTAQPTHAATPCWRKVVQDWYDNEEIDRTYPRRCYSEALRNVPEDVRVYTSFEESVRAALQRVNRNVRGLSSAGGPNDRPQQRPRGQRNVGGGDQPDLEPRRELFKQAFDKLGPREADAMPLPLLILGGLALALIAAGAAGLLARRFRARRAQAS